MPQPRKLCGIVSYVDSKYMIIGGHITSINIIKDIDRRMRKLIDKKTGKVFRAIKDVKDDTDTVTNVVYANPLKEGLKFKTTSGKKLNILNISAGDPVIVWTVPRLYAFQSKYEHNKDQWITGWSLTCFKVEKNHNWPE